jgi:hypothetical protein
VHALGHRAGEAVDGGRRAEDRLEVGLGDRRRVERAEPLLDRPRPVKRLLHGDLLVEREPDEKRHRIARDQRVRLVRVREVEAVWHKADGSRPQTHVKHMF